MTLFIWPANFKPQNLVFIFNTLYHPPKTQTLSHYSYLWVDSFELVKHSTRFMSTCLSSDMSRWSNTSGLCSKLHFTEHCTSCPGRVNAVSWFPLPLLSIALATVKSLGSRRSREARCSGFCVMVAEKRSFWRGEVGAAREGEKSLEQLVKCEPTPPPPELSYMKNEILRYQHLPPLAIISDHQHNIYDLMLSWSFNSHTSKCDPCYRKYYLQRYAF